MVKFAEAEKRGRGGEGGDRKLTPIMMLERPKISRGMWESLKEHIIKERRRKKEELEADAEEKRIRKERENRKKQHAMTLEETREQIVKADQKLALLKDQKHDLVQQLKKVLNEETRRKDQEHQQQQQKQHQQQQQQQLHHQQQQSTYMKDSEMVQVHPYGHGPLSIGGHPQMMFPSAMVPGRSANISTLYKVGVPTTQSLQNVMPAGTLKRSRSPSPQPSQSSYQQLPFVFKSLPGNQTSVVPVTLTSSKSPSATSVYLSSQPPGSYYHSSNKGTHGSSQYPSTTQAAVVAPYLTTPAGPPPLSNQQSSQGPQTSARDDNKHLQPIYLPGGRGHVSSLHPSLDHKGKPTLGPTVSSSGPYPPSDGQDKFYVSGVRPHLVLHTGVLPVQQQPPPNSTKGSISSGFPVRGPQPPSTQGQSSASHSYSAHSINLSRNYF